MKFNKQSSTDESEKDQAQTPWWFVNSVRDFFGIDDFILDVCAEERTKKGITHYSLDNGKNGLESCWSIYNWCNPPFSNIEPWIRKAVAEANHGLNTAMIFPANYETKYHRLAVDNADTIINMPFRLKFLRPNGEMFLDKHGKEQSPQFSCTLAWFTALGIRAPTRHINHDFREGFL